MTKDTGGPAFPIEVASLNFAAKGMTLRDYFAAQVAVGTMSAYWNGDRMKDPTFHDIAQDAYALADAMLKARRT
jgi:hypothetical protein